MTVPCLLVACQHADENSRHFWSVPALNALVHYHYYLPILTLAPGHPALAPVQHPHPSRKLCPWAKSLKGILVPYSILIPFSW